MIVFDGILFIFQDILDLYQLMVITRFDIYLYIYNVKKIRIKEVDWIKCPQNIF